MYGAHLLGGSTGALEQGGTQEGAEGADLGVEVELDHGGDQAVVLGRALARLLGLIEDEALGRDVLGRDQRLGADRGADRAWLEDVGLLVGRVDQVAGGRGDAHRNRVLGVASRRGDPDGLLAGVHRRDTLGVRPNDHHDTRTRRSRIGGSEWLARVGHAHSSKGANSTRKV